MLSDRQTRSGSRKNPLLPPDPALTDGTVALRPWELRDASSLAAAWNDPDIMQFSAVPEARELRDAEAWIGGGAYRRMHRIAIDLVVTAPGSPAVIGEVGLWGFDEASNGAMLGYWLHKAHRSQGLASRAVTLVVEWAISPTGLNLSLVVAKVARDNRASEKLLRSLGFRLERNDTDGHRLFTLRVIDANETGPGG